MSSGDEPGWIEETPPREVLDTFSKLDEAERARALDGWRETGEITTLLWGRHPAGVTVAEPPNPADLYTGAPESIHATVPVALWERAPLLRAGRLVGWRYFRAGAR